MSDFMGTINTEVEIQENGIIKLNGAIIARLNIELTFDNIKTMSNIQRMKKYGI